MLTHHVNISREMRLAMEAKQREEPRQRARPFGDGRYTLDQVLAAVQIIRPGFGQGLGPEQAERLTPPLRDEAVRFLDALTSSSAPPGAAPPAVNSGIPSEREFIRHAVAVFEMVAICELTDGKYRLTLRHGDIEHTLDLIPAPFGHRPQWSRSGDLIAAFAGLVEGCVREGRKLLAAYDAQGGTP